MNDDHSRQPGQPTLTPGGRIQARQDDGTPRDITDQAASLLFENVAIHQDFTVRDLFLLMERNALIFNQIFYRDHFREWVGLFRDIESANVVAIGVGDRDEIPVDAVELAWIIHANQGEDWIDREIRERIESGVAGAIEPSRKIVTADGDDLGDIFAEAEAAAEEGIRARLSDGSYWGCVKADRWVGGLGFPECGVIFRGKGRKGGTRGSMTLLRLEALLPARLVLSNELLLVRKDRRPGTRGAQKRLANPGVTLGQLIKGFLWELSFHGPPDDRAKVGRDLEDAIRRARRTSGGTVDG